MLFISSLGDVLSQVDAAVAASDLATLAAMGHRAKSTAMNIGAAEFSEQCLLLEQSAKANQVDSALRIAHGLRPLFDGIKAEIDLRLAS
ncbi:Hpt domain-containing protein [Rhodoferax aquaticus]